MVAFIIPNLNIKGVLPSLMEPYWHIIDKELRSIPPLLIPFREDGFYLAGGTGLALQLGHRDSEDFDFFIKQGLDTIKLKEKISSLFS